MLFWKICWPTKWLQTLINKSCEGKWVFLIQQPLPTKKSTTIVACSHQLLSAHKRSSSASKLRSVHPGVRLSTEHPTIWPLLLGNILGSVASLKRAPTPESKKKGLRCKRANILPLLFAIWSDVSAFVLLTLSPAEIDWPLVLCHSLELTLTCTLHFFCQTMWSNHFVLQRSASFIYSVLTSLLWVH